jgi:hypothetical protein
MLRFRGSAKSDKLPVGELKSASWTAPTAQVPPAFFDPRQLRARWFADMTTTMDEYMRSRAFLEALRYVVTATTYAQWIRKHHMTTHATGNGTGHGPKTGSSYDK